jgi:hypothetical protein
MLIHSLILNLIYIFKSINMVKVCKNKNSKNIWTQWDWNTGRKRNWNQNPSRYPLRYGGDAAHSSEFYVLNGMQLAKSLYSRINRIIWNNKMTL